MGNKNDDPAKKKVDTQDAVQFGESLGVPVFETSAKENKNVEEVKDFIHFYPKIPTNHLAAAKIIFSVKLLFYFMFIFS